MNSKAIFLGVSALLIVVGGWSAESPKPAAPSKPKLALSIKPQHVADALRAVIISDREVYAEIVREHLASGSSNRVAAPLSSADFPAPCQMLRRGSQAAASKGVEYSYVLRSIQPVNKRNSPETDVETKGLQFIATRSDLTFTSEELLGGRWYFTAVYPDVATHESCVTCHNQLQSGARNPFKLGDVIGALVIRVALEL